jgi:hypothetical protein
VVADRLLVVVGHSDPQGLLAGDAGTEASLEHLAGRLAVAGTLNGQGLFTVLSGIGAVVFDVGHYVFDDDTQETLFASPKVIPFEEDFDFGAAICAALDHQ